MLRTVLWIALGCAVLLAALWLSRQLEFGSGPAPKANAPAVQEAAEPAAAKAPEPEVAPAPPPTPEELQVQEDAAATGMTTVEPSEDQPAPPEPPPASPPQ